MNVDVIPFEQPAGSFLLAILPASELIRISKADPRRFDEASMDTAGGIQRDPSWKRINEIAAYASTVDAAFPTPILLALDERDYRLRTNNIEITGDHVADIVDGQHRIEGLKVSDAQQDFIIPVVFILSPTEEQKALIFATINGKQTKVPASLIYDLFGVTKTRSPQKTAHEIARALNSTPDSPWFKRLKMLGRKTPGSQESLSQGTFVKFLLPCISKRPDLVRDTLKRNEEAEIENDCVFSEYFIKDKDSTILKILLNVFKAAQKTWPEEWEDPEGYILTKTNGFTGIMKALPEMVSKGKASKDLSKGFFSAIFRRVKNKMRRDGMEFTIEHFEPSAAGETRFKNLILENLSG